MAATYDLRIDWNNDGDFNDTGEDVTQRVLVRDWLGIQYGRDQARALSPAAPGQATFTLNNESRDYSPENGSSPLAGNVIPNRSVRIQATLSAVTYTLFRGHIDDFDISPDIGNKVVSVTCLDGLTKLRGVKLSTPLYHSIQTGTAIGYILDAVGWPIADRDLDIGASTIRWWWEEGTDAFDALNKVLLSEGPPAFVYLGSDGAFTFRDRHHRLIRAASTSSQQTFWGHPTNEPNLTEPLVYDHGWRDIINDVSFSIDERSPEGTRTAVWDSDLVYSISDGQTVPVIVQASEPFRGAVTPVAGTDYQLQSGAVTVTLSRTSGQSATIFVQATGGPAVIANLQLRAYPVSVQRTVQVSAQESTSIGKYDLRSYPDDVPFANANDADAIAGIILAQRAERLPIVSMRLLSANDTRLTQQLTRDLSDRIHLTESEIGIDDDFFIDRIEHSTDGVTHETVFGCEKAPVLPSSVFILDTGLLGTNTLGALGLDDPTTVFILDDGLLGTERLAY